MYITSVNGLFTYFVKLVNEKRKKFIDVACSINYLCGT
uniref:Uncharacterized protein n=1 Tax=Rhizophora mucronata TaxID=61149 RepID=A0A2P2PAZ9_RHIMU